MWLAHDDWIDPAYIARCSEALDRDPAIAAAGGRALYYADGALAYRGVAMNVLDDDPHARVRGYFARLSDNAIFYGVARRDLLARVTLRPGMAFDWVAVAGLAFQGKMVTLDDVALHRALGGASRTNQGIGAALGLPAWQAALQLVTPSIDLFREIAQTGGPFHGDPRRVRLGAEAAALAFVRRAMRALGRRDGLAGRWFPSLRAARIAEQQRAAKDQG
jgi:hypothetical protein